MTSSSDPKSGSPLPEDIASRAGMPREGEMEHSLHEIRNGILGQSGAQDASAGGVRDAYDDVRSTARAGGQDAARAGEDLADRAGEAASDVRSKVRDTYEDARAWASDRYADQRRRAADLADRGYARYERGRGSAEDFVGENPLVVGVVGLAAGLLIGALLPRTRSEDRTLGPWADEARGHGLRYAREATQQGRRFVERTLDPDNLEATVQRAAAGKGHADPARPDADERTAYSL